MRLPQTKRVLKASLGLVLISNLVKYFLSEKWEETCKPREKVVFTKTHKTGSSTLQNILFRFGEARNFTFTLAPPSESPWMFSLSEPFKAEMALNGSWAVLGFDIFAFHSKWNYVEVKKLIPEAFFFTVLRDPVDCFESNYIYFDLKKQLFGNLDLNDFAEKKIIASDNPTRMPKQHIEKNQQSWDLGLETENMENMTFVAQKLKEWDSQFNYVLLLEYFDESLVILAKKLCWDLENFRYLKVNSRKDEKRTKISPETRKKLRSWLRADVMLYNQFKEKFELEMDSYGREQLAIDTERLRRMNQEVREDCVLAIGGKELKQEFRLFYGAEGYAIDETKPWCVDFARTEPEYVVKLRAEHKKRAEEEFRRYGS